ncbi:Oxoglutarate dehydrogenase inhibitor [Microbulbifer aggregans]|uniref:Oxoglutarate dehydrogenase inhibitor n=1 Tax=Microbulbifer aggregans TaxID=1769779 RepID=A0A1C9W9K5_9GAMM|nr:FHA domain-containing protein [Microbulbifer aggregans]AOS97785.1 Oxoglutarate dehydrogenase inhibitor [Microbulbifer aggregans]
MLKLCDLKDVSQSVWLVAPKVTIGRASNCDLTIADESVAKLQVEILVEDDSLVLRNLAEHGVVTVNGQQVERSCPLKLNDKVTIGSRTLGVVDPKVTRLKAASSAASVAWALRANHPAIAGKVFPVRETTVVGRSDECDITFSLSHLSRRHARLEVRDGLLFVTDLGSANGTYLNNKRVVETRVRRGDELRFDTLSFSVVGPADDLDKTTVRPAITIPPEVVRSEGQVEAQVRDRSASVAARAPAASDTTRERQRMSADAEAIERGQGVWPWVGVLTIAAVVIGYFWARGQGLL